MIEKSAKSRRYTPTERARALARAQEIGPAAAGKERVLSASDSRARECRALRHSRIGARRPLSLDERNTKPNLR
jgi:hypothetical protein